MARKTKKIKKSFSRITTVKPADELKIFSGKSFRLTRSKKDGGGKTNFRFSFSLIILIAVLITSSLIFLMSLISAQTAQGDSGQSFSSAPVSSAKKLIKPVSQELNDPNLDFKLTVPAQLGEWMYRTGDIKSPVDDGLSDQYLQIYLPIGDKTNSRNFNETTTAILTIKKFTTDEWEKLGKGCQKDNTLFCEAAGTKIAEKNGSVYAYNKISNCPSGMESKCGLVDKIVGGFQLK